MARSTPARSTVSGVLSSWLASAVKRRNAAKLRSNRVIIWFSVSVRRPNSSFTIGWARRRWRLLPSVISRTSVMIWSTGSSARRAIHAPTSSVATSPTGRMRISVERSWEGPSSAVCTFAPAMMAPTCGPASVTEWVA